MAVSGGTTGLSTAQRPHAASQNANGIAQFRQCLLAHPAGLCATRDYVKRKVCVLQDLISMNHQAVSAAGESLHFHMIFLDCTRGTSLDKQCSNLPQCFFDLPSAGNILTGTDLASRKAAWETDSIWQISTNRIPELRLSCENISLLGVLHVFTDYLHVTNEPPTSCGDPKPCLHMLSYAFIVMCSWDIIWYNEILKEQVLLCSASLHEQQNGDQVHQCRDHLSNFDTDTTRR